ncbi:MAG TPA: GNAT family N-acetyltransferase [Rhizomicrobium sp.]|jgi:phosphinothricin acetyltransferase|nr:GNAT family N-acetyltransferase [Rhizomicrobium sp.]
MGELLIRKATPDDLPSLTEIYNHYVRTTPITFDIAPRMLEQRREWLAQFSDRGRYQCFVAVEDGAPIGWACSAMFKEKAAYETSIETSVYCAPGQTGKGLGRRLYKTLFGALKGEDIHRAYAGVTLPNDASIALHTALGFKLMGTYHEPGRKFGKFWDVAIFERDMA